MLPIPGIRDNTQFANLRPKKPKNILKRKIKAKMITISGIPQDGRNRG
jgi:hypothetical protein